FTEATLRTVPIPAGRSLAFFGFASFDAAIRGAQIALPGQPSACELIDRRLVSLARGRGADVAALVPAAAEAVLLVEFETDSPADAREAASRLVDRLYRTEGLALYGVTAFAADEMDRLWQLRENALPNLFGLRGGPQPVAFVEDVAV